jgi:hypothetical protein
VTWSFHFLAGYGLVEAACQLNTLTAPFGVAGLSVVAFLVLLLTVVALLVILYSGWLAYVHWRRLKAEAPEKRRDRRPHPRAKDRAPSAPSGPDGTARDMTRFMAVGGLLLSGLFAFVTIATGLPVLVLAPCL